VIRGAVLPEQKKLTADDEDSADGFADEDSRRMARDESLSDELIAPNLDQNISFFYDPSYEKAAETIREVSRRVTNSGGFLSRLGKDANRFAKRIRAER
jgi:hypothetical protein